jgi:hypothetical protein
MVSNRAAALLLCLLTACALRDVPGPPGEEQVVVQGILTTQTTQQVLWIERTIPAGEPVSGELRPLPVPPDRVEVRDSTGLVLTFQADPGNSARFLASFTPAIGRRYDLLIEVGSRVLTASTRVPDAVTIVDPPADTITVPRDSFSVTWSGPTRTIRIAYADTTGRAAYAPPVWVVDDTVAQLSWIPDLATSISALQVWVLAVDSVTARVRDSFLYTLGDSFSPTTGNINGGAGFFGAATADHIVVRLQ